MFARASVRTKYLSESGAVLSSRSRYPRLKEEDEKGRKVEGEGKGRRGGEKGSELLRRPEADGGRAIAAGCSSSFFDLGLAY